MEAPGIFTAEKLVQMLARLHYLLVPGVQQRKVIEKYYGIKRWHLRLGEFFPDRIPHKKHPRFGVVYKMVYITAFEFMQQRYGDCPVGKGGKEGDSPVGLVPGAYSKFVTCLYTTYLQHNMYLLYSSRHIPVIQCHSLVVGQCRAIPVLFNAVFNRFVQRCCHIIIIIVGI